MSSAIARTGLAVNPARVQRSQGSQAQRLSGTPLAKHTASATFSARKTLQVDAVASRSPGPRTAYGGDRGPPEQPAEAKKGPVHEPPPTRVVVVNSGKETFAKLVDTGVLRSKLPYITILIQSIMAGCFIGFGGVLCSSVGGDVPALAAQNPGLQRFLFGAIGFPLSIFLVTLTEMHAFTASLCLYTVAVYEGFTKKTRMSQVLLTTWIGNTIGLLGMASLAVLGNMDCVKPCWDIAAHKLDATWMQIFFRGVGGGWLICMAVVLSTTANDVISKFIGIWMCISTYVVCGWEHALANIFFIPAAIMSGAPITWSACWWDSIVPSSLGNIVGGILMVGMALATVHSTDNNAIAWGNKVQENYDDDDWMIPLPIDERRRMN